MRCLLAVITVLSLTGCSRTDTFPLGSVSGTVTLDGKPLPDAFVNFQPVGGPGSTAITDDQGRYSLNTIDGEPGAVIGLHKVTIYSAHSTEAASEDESIVRTPKEIIPDKYNYDSKLTFEVPAGGTSSADWALRTSS
ncbi:carboxypeptidase regulatory-like domain-containing protein [Aeoliella sp. SH292]|uniref:carboxypeptidase regulatory-like domain-containing protein n=1 Tax=Aeoliella sp. SH292 TaxID=3454464 RepID=UPI003F980639